MTTTISKSTPAVTITAERQAQIDAREAQLREESRQGVARRFGIPLEDIVGTNSGACYDKVWVKTKESAEKVAECVKGDEVNGGMFGGMPLGGITFYDGVYEVMC